MIMKLEDLGCNIDFTFIVQAVDRDFNINRIERSLTICNTSNVKPIIILNKIAVSDCNHNFFLNFNRRNLILLIHISSLIFINILTLCK